jgi:DNA-directed RNA polymerase subunit RPC12/RpoP
MMFQTERECPFCGHIAKLENEKRLEPRSWKVSYVCTNCKRRHIVIWRSSQLETDEEIKRLEEIESMDDKGMSDADIAKKLGVTPQRIRQIRKGE